MSAIQRFTEKAIEGGYTKYDGNGGWGDGENVECFYQMLLDPESWKAVGKVCGWRESKGYVSINCSYNDCYHDQQTVEEFTKEHPEIWEEIKDGEYFEKDNLHYNYGHSTPEWDSNMFQMVHTLIQGKTIEEYLTTIV